jgi:glycosyltransferase involved in cell wall biosynthesis
MTDLGASIVVPSRGGARRLPVLLSALARQDTDNFEVIVVVDGDVDGSGDVIETIVADRKIRLRSVLFPENRGRSAALNAGASVAVGQILIRCDDDFEPGPDYVSGHIRNHVSEPAGIIGLARNVFPETTYARVYGRLIDVRFRSEAVDTPPERQWRYWGGNVSVPRGLHERIGGYDEGFRTYGWEDVDYGYRLRKAGIPVRIAPELTTDHHIAATTTRIRALRALHSGAAREMFLNKHGAAALTEGVPPATGVWNRLVLAGSMLASERTLRISGAAVDALARLMPVAIAEKLVALTVESAGLAGMRYPERARASF